MPLFELDSGRLVPAQFGRPVTEPLEPEVLDAVRDQVLEIVQRPLFPVSWHERAAGGESARRLTAMDPAGQAVSVEVVARLDAVTLVSALSCSGRASELGWLQLAELYPRGVGAFRRDWNAFRESLPVRHDPGPRLIVVAGVVDPEVRPALDVLGEAGVEVHELSVRQMSNGRRFLESHEVPAAAIAAADRVLAGRVTQSELLPAAPAETAAPRYAGEADHGIVDRVPGAVSAPPREEHEPRVHGSEEDTPAMGVTGPAPDLAAGPEPAGDAVRPEPAGDAVRPTPDLAALAGAVGEEVGLVWPLLRRGVRYHATLTPEGRLRLPEGDTFADPTEAARTVSGRQEVDGWRVWHFGETGPSLADAWGEVSAAESEVVPVGGRGRRRG